MKLNSSDSFIVIYTQDIGAIVAFYKSLSIEVSDISVTNATVRLGGHEIHFVLSSSEPNSSYDVAISTVPTPTNTIYYVEVPDINDAYTGVQDAKATICAEIYINSWGAKEFLFKDPAGTFIALYQML
jgi:predicted enzyme related to lactoylglutathione lyase